MLNSIVTTIAGNIVADPELKKAGKADVTNVTMAFTPRVKVQGTEDEYEDGDTTFIRLTAWRREAENIVASFKKGDRVVVTGALKFRHYTDEHWAYFDDEGEEDTDKKAKFISVEMDVHEAGLSTAFATVSATKAKKKDGGSESSDSDEGEAKPARRRAKAAPVADEEF